MRKSNKIIVSVAALVLSFAAATLAFAADLRMAPQNNAAILVDQNQHVRNLYAAGATIEQNANSAKDSVLAGSTILINGNIADSLLAAGGNIFVKGTVGGSARIAGGNITLENKIGEDLLVLGGNTQLTSTAEVDGDVLAAGGSFIINAPVKGNIRFAGGRLLINSKVDGSVNVIAGQLQFGPAAVVSGTINYKGNNPALIDPAAKVSSIHFVQRTQPQMNFNPAAVGAAALLAFLLSLAAAIIAAYVLFALFPKRFEHLVNSTMNGFWNNVLYGFIAFVVIPVAAIICAFTLIGLFVALLLAVWYFLTLLVAGLLASAAFGSYLLSRFKKNTVKVNYGTIAFGLFIVAVIKTLPVIGFIFCMLLIFAGLGTMIKAFNKERLSN